jgi:putative tricarboxylic transport membrane protein
MARLLVDIIQRNNLSKQTIMVVNKPGGSSAAGHSYVNSKANPNYTLFTANTAHVLSWNINKSVSPKGPFTPIANLAMDNVLFVTSASSPYYSFQDAYAAIMASPGSLTVGTADNLDELCVVQVNQETGSDFNTVYFNSAGEIATAMLGDHIEFGIFNPGECIGLVEGGKLRVLASFSPTRISAPFENIPTFTELGFPAIVFQMSRSIMGPALMSREAQLYWSEVFAQVTATEQWKKDYIEKDVLEGLFLGADDFAKYHVESERMIVEAAKLIGIL